jgi:putative ABC transport system permease protein
MYRQVVERAEAIPGVQSASLARWSPFSGGNSLRSLLIQGHASPPNVFQTENDRSRTVRGDAINVNNISTRWFETMGVEVRKGRDFTARDDSGTTRVAIVNETLVRKHFEKGEDPLGQRLSFGDAAGPWHEIVGVVSDIKVNSLTEEPQSLVFVPLLQNHETGVTLFVRSKTGSITAIAPAIQSALQALEPNLPLSTVSSMGELVNTSLYTARSGARMIIGFGFMALLLAAIGLYGVISYAVSRRTKELGLRIALGAHPRAVMRQIVGEATKLATLGIAGGIAIAFSVTRLLQSFLYGVSTTDGTTFVVISVVMMVVAVAASIIPARRAMRIDPIRALRTE